MDMTNSTDEARRLAALHALDLLDSAPEREFDALAALAAEMLACPTAMVTLVDHDRQWVKARSGTTFEETPRSVAFCDHTIRHRDPLVVEDAACDPRFAASPLVTGDRQTRFYAGAPIQARGLDGELHAIGAICVVDAAPRSLSAQGEATLRHLACLAEALIAARRTAIDAVALARESESHAAALAAQKRIFERAERMATIGSWRLTLADDRLTWSDEVFRIHGLPRGQFPPLTRALDHYPPQARAMVAGKLAAIVETGEPFDFESDFLTAAGDVRRVRSRGEVEHDASGGIEAVVGVFQDITDEFRLKEQLRRSADTDFLTGVANRAGFDRVLEATMARAERQGTAVAVAMLDLDAFKQINDSFGHDAGDDVLRAVAARLAAPWLAGCFAGRLGGDEFALVIEDPATIADPAAFASQLEEAIAVTLTFRGIPVWCGGSVGVAIVRPGEPKREVLRRADAALYAAKRDRIGRRHAA